MNKASFLSFLLLFFLLRAQHLQAAPNLLLQCLAKEEEILFKKSKQDALFRLNQDFVNELASSNDIFLKKNYIDEICHSKLYSPSVGLLRLLLLKEQEVFDLSLSSVDPSLRPFKMGYIHEFQKQIPRIFIQFISGLQADMSTPECLNRHIPELIVFNEKLKYLEMESTSSSLLADKKRIESIFFKLRNLASIKKLCLSEKKSKRSVKKK